MAKHKREIVSIPTVQGPTIVVELFYELGGINYATGRHRERGYYISVAPVEIEQGEGYQVRKYMAFSGAVMRVKSANRFSQKALDTFNPEKEDIEKVLRDVVNRNNLTLKEKECQVQK